jgi:hypothetical protein
VAKLGVLRAIQCDWDGNRLPNTRIMRAQSAQIPLRSLDAFPGGSVQFGAGERASVQALTPFTTLKFYEAGRGRVGWGIIHDPTLQVKDNGNTIAINFPNITDQLTQNSTHPGALFTTSLGAIVRQLGSISETIEWQTLLSGSQIVGYLARAPEATYSYDASGNLLGTYPGTGKFSPWSATMLDDAPNTLSSAPVDWVAITQNLTSNGNNLTKNTLTAPYYDAAAIGAQNIASVVDQTGAPARGDASFSWRMANMTSEFICGLSAPSGSAYYDVRFGFQFIPAFDPSLAHAYGVFHIWDNGTLSGYTNVYHTGDTFAVSIDYSNGPTSPRAIYYMNGSQLAFTASTIPALPLVPLAVMLTPGGSFENAILTTTCRPSQQWYTIQFEDQTPLESILLVAQNTGIHVRQAIDAAGIAQRSIEVGTFGQQSGVRLTGRKGINLAQALANPSVRVIDSLTWTQESSKVINTITPLGANNSNGNVDLELCWRIVNDPTYQSYGRWGNVVGSVFVEYNPARFPIRRTLGRNGHWVYYVVDLVAYAAVGREIRGKYTDSQFQYTSSSPADMEQTARALYIATMTKLLNESVVNDTIQVETVGTFLPPAAGSKVKMDFAHIGGDTEGNFTIMSSRARQNLRTPYLIGVDRVYDEGGTISDRWQLSFLPRLPNGTQSVGGSALRQLNAIKIIQQNTTTYLPVFGEADVDGQVAPADHSLVVEVPIPKDVFRIVSAPLYVRLSPLRQQATTADNPTQTYTFTIPTTGVTISTGTLDVTITSIHDDHTLAGGTYDAASATFAGTTDGFSYSQPDNSTTGKIQLIVKNYGTVTPAGQNLNAELRSGHYELTSQGVANGTHVLAGIQVNLDPATTASALKLPLHQNVSVSPTLTGTIDNQVLKGVIDQVSFSATMPPHRHPINVNLHDTFAPTLVNLQIDPGDGVFKYVSNDVVDGLSQLVGPWSQDFNIVDLSPYLKQCAGKMVRLKLTSDGSANEGVGHIKAFGLWKAEIGGLGSTVLPVP